MNARAARPAAHFAALALTFLLLPISLSAQDLVLRNASVIDVTTGEVEANATVVVRDGKVVSIGAAGSVDGVTSIDVRGMFLAPGLIDAHVHIATFEQASRALASGVTTARSMGVANYADVGLRRLAEAGAIEAPEMVAAGYHVRPSPAEEFFNNHPQMARYLGDQMRGPTALQEMAETMLAADVDFIKVNATERAGLPDTDPRKQFYSTEEMRALVTAASAAGARGVSAHAHGDEGGRAAVEAGVKSIEHGTYLSGETLELMAERGTYLVPTMAIVRDLTIPGGDYESPVLQLRGRHMLPRVQETVARAHSLGVPIVAATDTGYGPNGVVRLSHELAEFVEIGMTPLEALQAGTRTAAQLLGVDDHTGTIAPGMDADLVLTERNPLEDISALDDVLMVINNGKVVMSKGDWLVPGRAPIPD